MADRLMEMVWRMIGKVRFPEVHSRSTEEAAQELTEARIAHAAGIAAHDAVLREFRLIERGHR